MRQVLRCCLAAGLVFIPVFWLSGSGAIETGKQSTSTYSIPWSVINAGGAVGLSSANHRLSTSLGEPATGTLQSDNYTLYSGFWNPSLIIPAVVARPGDFDGDGKVWTSDFMLFVANFGLTQGDRGFNPDFDLDNDGKVWTGDFSIFVGLFGTRYGASKSIVSVEDAGKNQNARISLKIAQMDPAARAVNRAASPSAQTKLIVVDICLEGAIELRGYGMRIDYDPEVLEFFGATADNGQGNLLNSRGGTTPLFLLVSGRNKPGEIWIANALAGPETVNGSGLLARLSFRAIGDPFGPLPFSVGAIDLFDGKFDRNSLRAGDLASADLGVVLRSYGLGQNYPNPFNPWTTISYQLPERVFVSLKVYNVLGELVRTLQEGKRPAGRHTVQWDGEDNSGRFVASGVYFYRITAGNFSKTGKMLLIR